MTEPTQNYEDPSTLLNGFLASGRSEGAFARLVEQLGGLVFSSALRRTGDPHLAEEVTQNVFALLARKAAALQRHPSLTAWVFQTTKYEASQAMRAERRRKRKHDALAIEAKAQLTQSPDPEWHDAVPHLDASLDRLPEKDRELVLLRFFENRKYREIAEATGRSEAACKVQLKRVLQKLSTFLTTRGVTLSVATLASAIAAEIAKAAPAQSAGALASNALAASQSITLVSAISNSIYTMSTLKTVSITGTAVLALAVVPLYQQASEASKLAIELNQLTLDERAMKAEAAQAGSESPSSPGNGSTRSQTMGALMDLDVHPVDVQTFLDSIHHAMSTMDMFGMIKAFIPVSQMSTEGVRKLTDDVQAAKADKEIKEVALQFLGSMLPTTGPQEKLERMMSLTVEPHAYSAVFATWADSDLEAAEAWYLEQLHAGKLEGKGTSDRPDLLLYRQLVASISKHDPDRSIEMFLENDGENYRTAILMELAGVFAQRIKDGKGDSALAQLLEAGLDTNEKKNAVRAAMVALEEKDLERGREFIDRYLGKAVESDGSLDPRALLLVDLVRNQESMSLSDRGDWLLNQLDSKNASSAILSWIGIHELSDPNEESEIAIWIEQQSLEIRNSGFTALATKFTNGDAYLKAYNYAQRIENEKLRQPRLTRIARQWAVEDTEEAAKHLPLEIFKLSGIVHPSEVK